MSVIIQEDYALSRTSTSPIALPTWLGRRAIIAIAGCAVMAVSGIGLGIYFDTSSAMAADASSSSAPQADAAPLN